MNREEARKIAKKHFPCVQYGNWEGDIDACVEAILDATYPAEEKVERLTNERDEARLLVRTLALEPTMRQDDMCEAIVNELQNAVMDCKREALWARNVKVVGERATRMYKIAHWIANRCEQSMKSWGSDYSIAKRAEASESREQTLREALMPFARIEVPHDASDGTWVAETKFCNDQVTAFQVRKAREALANTEVSR